MFTHKTRELVGFSGLVCRRPSDPICTFPSTEGEDPGEVCRSLEDRVCWQGATVLPGYAFLVGGGAQAQAGDTDYASFAHFVQ